MTTLDSILGGYSTQDFVFSPAIRATLENNILTQLLTANRDAAVFNTTLTVEGLASKAAEVERVDTPSQISGQILAEVSQLLGQGEQTLTEENLAAIANLVDGFIPPAREVATVTSRIASQTGDSTLNEYLDSASADLNTSAEVLLERSRQANGQQINIHAGNLVQHTSGSIIQRSNGPYMLSTPSAQTTARTIVHQSSYDINIADAHHQEGRVSFHNHESLIQNLGQEATSIQGPRTIAAQNQSLIATETLQTTSNTLQLAAAGEYSIAANEARQSFQEGVTTRAAFAMEQYGSLSPVETTAETSPAALQDVQNLLNRFTSLEGSINGLIQVVGLEGSHVRINRGVDYQSSSVEVQVTEGVTLSSRAGYVELTAGGITLRGIPGFEIQPPEELLLVANEIKEGLESINALLNLSQITQDLSLCDPREVIRRRQEKRERKERCRKQSEQGTPLDRDCEKVIGGVPSGTRGDNPTVLTTPSTGTSSGGVVNLPNLPSTNATGPGASRNNFPTVSPNTPPLSPLSAVVAGSQALGGSIDSWLVESTPNIENANDPPQVPTFNLDQDLALELAQRQGQPDVPLDRLQSLPSNFSELESQVRAVSVELPDGLSIPVINNETRLRPQPIPQANVLEPQIGLNQPSLDEVTDRDVSESGLDFSTQQARIDQLLSRLQIDSSYETLKNYLPPEADLGALTVFNSHQPQQEALDGFVSLISEALIRQQTEQVLGPEYRLLVNPVVDLLKEGVDIQDIPGALMNVLGTIDPRLSGVDGLVQSALRSVNPFNGNATSALQQSLPLLEPNDPLSLAVAAASLIGQDAVREVVLSALQGGRTSQDVLLAVLQQLGGPGELINDVIGRVTQVQGIINSGTLSQLIRDRDFTGLLSLGASLDPTGILSSTIGTLMPVVDLFQTLTKIPDLLNALSDANVPLLSRFNLLLGCLDLIKKVQAVLDLFDGDQDLGSFLNPLELQGLPVLGSLNSLVNSPGLQGFLSPGLQGFLSPAVLNSPTNSSGLPGFPALGSSNSPTNSSGLPGFPALGSSNSPTNSSGLPGFPALGSSNSPINSNRFPTVVFSRLPSSRRLPARVLEFLPLQTQIIRTIQSLPPSLIPQAEPAQARAVLNSEGVLESIEVTYPGVGYRSDFNNVQVEGSEVSVRVEGGSIQSIEVIRGEVYSSPPKVYINPQPPLSAQLPIPPEVLNQLYRVDLDRFSDECFQVPRLTLQNSRLELIQLSGSQVIFRKTYFEDMVPVKGMIQLLIPTYERLEDGVRLYPYQKESFYTPLIHTAYIQDYNLTSNQGLALLDSANVFYLEDDNRNVGSYSYQDFGVTIIPNVELMYLLA